MNDNEIIELYWERSESAVAVTEKKYGGYCTVIAENILASREDSEECVNETWMRAWNAMPPDRPSRLSVFLGRITRNLAIDRYRRNQSQKFGGGQTAVCLEELSECISGNESFTDDLILKDCINRFLHSLPKDKRRIFMLRYWYLFPIREIAVRAGMNEGAVKMSLCRTRSMLKEFFEKEGIDI